MCNIIISILNVNLQVYIINYDFKYLYNIVIDLITYQF